MNQTSIPFEDAPRMLDYSVPQASLMRERSVTNSEELFMCPMMGIVLSVYRVDDSRNASWRISGGKKGYQVYCKIMGLVGGLGNEYPIFDALLLQRGKTGLDDFTEELPTPCSTELIKNASQPNAPSFVTLDPKNRTRDPADLDGDRVLVQFVGGRPTNAIIVGYFPHPKNIYDSAVEDDGKRTFIRRNGLKFTIDDEGSLEIDTIESNAKFTSPNIRGPRENGGDINIKLKKGTSGKALNITFGNGEKKALKVTTQTNKVHINLGDSTDSDGHVPVFERIRTKWHNFLTWLAGFISLYNSHTHTVAPGTPIVLQDPITGIFYNYVTVSIVPVIATTMVGTDPTGVSYEDTDSDQDVTCGGNNTIV